MKDLIIGISGVITGAGIIVAFFRKHFDNIVGKITSPILDRIDAMDKNQCMNYLIEFLADVKNGVHKSEYQKARAHEVYEHYKEDLHGNSYIKEQWDVYMKEGK